MVKFWKTHIPPHRDKLLLEANKSEWFKLNCSDQSWHLLFGHELLFSLLPSGLYGKSPNSFVFENLNMPGNTILGIRRDLANDFHTVLWKKEKTREGIDFMSSKSTSLCRMNLLACQPLFRRVPLQSLDW